MTTYTEAVAEARTLVKRSEDDQWRLAELTWEQVEAGKSRRQWAKDIGVSAAHADFLYIVWAKFSANRVGTSFADAYVMAQRGVNDPAEARQKAEESQAVGPIRNMRPERKAEVARELLADPDIAERVYDTPDRRVPGSTAARAVGNLARAGEKARQRDAERTERKTTEDPTSRRIDEREALHDLTAACDRFSREVGAALRRAGELPENEKRWLTEAADRAGHALASIRSYIDTGHTDLDAELIALLNGGAE